VGSKKHQAIRTIYLSIGGSIVLTLVKGLTGYIGNSYALIADAIESTGDVFSSIIVLIGLIYASRPADQNHPYGHGRIEPLITFLVVGFLVVSACIIAYESIQHILIPHELPQPYTLVVLGAIILTKEIFYRIGIKKSKETGSSSLKVDAWHHRSDAMTSLAAFIGISIALIFGKGYESADDWAALLACIVILYNSYIIFRQAFSEVMDEHVYDDLVIQIRKIATQVDGIIDTEKCFVRKVGITYYVDLHAIISGNITVREGHEIAHRLKDKLQKKLPELADVLIHMEPKE